MRNTSQDNNSIDIDDEPFQLVKKDSNENESTNDS